MYILFSTVNIIVSIGFFILVVIYYNFYRTIKDRSTNKELLEIFKATVVFFICLSMSSFIVNLVFHNVINDWFIILASTTELLGIFYLIYKSKVMVNPVARPDKQEDTETQASQEI